MPTNKSLPLFNEIIVDNFAGGGGASTGIERATGRSVDIAINHDQGAIDMHEVNHPKTKHYCESVWDVVPREIVKGRPVALVWLSPDCKHFSVAKGGKPVDKNIRGLAWIAIRWGATVKPRVIMLENVKEFQKWGPLLENGKPCKQRQGETFSSFVRALEQQKYRVETKRLIASDYGAATSRERLFMVSRRDNNQIVWPKQTHGDPNSKEVKSGKLLPWKTAADITDFSIRCPSIFFRKKDLVENTLKRIAKGLVRYVIDDPDPFVISYYTSKNDEFRGISLDQPLPTVTAGGNRFGLVAPFITEHANGSNQRNMRINEPLRTQCAQVKGGHFAVVTSHVIKLRNGCLGQPMTKPLPTITAGGRHLGEIRGFTLKYYGSNIGHSLNRPLQTVTTKERFASVLSECKKWNLLEPIGPTEEQRYMAWWIARFMEDYTVQNPTQLLTPFSRPHAVFVGDDNVLVDLGMRMYQPRELYNAHGFPPNYIIDRDKNGKKITKTDQIARVGNSVPPPFAEALVRANLPEMCLTEEPPKPLKSVGENQ